MIENPIDFYGHKLDVVRERLREAKSEWAINWLTQLEQQLRRNLTYALGQNK